MKYKVEYRLPQQVKLNIKPISEEIEADGYDLDHNTSSVVFHLDKGDKKVSTYMYTCVDKITPV